MSPARQAIRWSIPGTFFLLSLVFGQLVAVVGFDHQPDVGIELEQSNAALVVVLLAASIPIGFFIYQLYHAMLEEAIGWLPPFVVPLDRGRQILRRLTPEQRLQIRRDSGIEDIDAGPLPNRLHPWGLRRALELGNGRKLPMRFQGDEDVNPRAVYVYLRHQNWRAIKWALFNGLDPERSATLRKEYADFSDIYHSIGTCRLAVVLGFSALLLYDGSIHVHPIVNHWDRSIGVFIVWAGLVSAVFFVLTLARRHTLVSIQDLVADNLGRYIHSPDEAPSGEDEIDVTTDALGLEEDLRPAATAPGE